MSKDSEADPNDFDERDNAHAKDKSEQSADVREECYPGHAGFEKTGHQFQRLFDLLTQVVISTQVLQCVMHF